MPGRQFTWVHPFLLCLGCASNPECVAARSPGSRDPQASFALIDSDSDTASSTTPYSRSARSSSPQTPCTDALPVPPSPSFHSPSPPTPCSIRYEYVVAVPPAGSPAPSTELCHSLSRHVQALVALTNTARSLQRQAAVYPPAAGSTPILPAPQNRSEYLQCHRALDELLQDDSYAASASDSVLQLALHAIRLHAGLPALRRFILHSLRTSSLPVPCVGVRPMPFGWQSDAPGSNPPARGQKRRRLSIARGSAAGQYHPRAPSHASGSTHSALHPQPVLRFPIDHEHAHSRSLVAADLHPEALGPPRARSPALLGRARGSSGTAPHVPRRDLRGRFVSRSPSRGY